MNSNIKINYKNGKVEDYVTLPSDDLNIPRMAFTTESEAEAVVAIARLLKENGKNLSDLPKVVPCVFRVLGIVNEWTV